MTGAIAIVVVIVLVLPPLYLITGAVLSAIMGWVLKSNAEDEHAGSEFVDLNY